MISSYADGIHQFLQRWVFLVWFISSGFIIYLFISMLQALGTQGVALNAHGYFYDRYNRSLLYIRQGGLFCQNLADNSHNQITLVNSAVPSPSLPQHWLLTLSGSAASGIERNIFTTTSQEVVLRGVREVVEGSHWEWYAPISLQKIQLGVCKIQENQAITYELYQFNSSTPRTVSFYASATQLKVWVNGNHPNKQESKKIDFTAKDKWYPCVKIQEKGNTIIYLPFSTLPSKEYSPYNPFGKIDTTQPTLSNCSNPRKAAKISKLIQLDIDRFLIHWQDHSARLYERNSQTGKFDFSSFSVSQDTAYDLFTLSEMELINKWRGDKQLSISTLLLSEAYSLLRYWISLLDSQQSDRQDLYSLLLCKLALIRPYLAQTGLRIPNLVAALELDRQSLHNVLKYFKAGANPTACSSVIHSNTQHKLQGQIVQVTSHYIVSQSEGSIIIYSTKGCIKQLFRETLDTKLIFSKRAATENYEEGDIRNLKNEGSFIYKILATCLQKQKKPQQLHPVSEGDVKELVRDYGIDDKSARQALEYTGNVEEALVWIFTDRKEGFAKKGESSTNIENQKQITVNLIEVNNLFAKLILQVGNRIFLLGVLPAELKNWVQKGEKEYVDLFSLKHQDQVEQLNWQQWFNGAKHPKLHILDQIQLQQTPLILYSEDESVYFLSRKDGDRCFRSKLSFNFDFVYEPQPSLKVESTEQYSSQLNVEKEAIFKTVKGEIITPQSYGSATFKEETICIINNKVYHNIVQERVEVSTLSITLKDPLIPTLQESSEVCLPFLVQSCAPGCNNNYSPNAILNPKASFLANYSQEIVLRHLHNKIWKPTSLTLQRSNTRKNINCIIEGKVYLTDGNGNKSKVTHFVFQELQSQKQIKLQGIQGYWKYIHISPIYPAVKKLPYEVGFISIKGFDTSPENYRLAEKSLLERKLGELIGKQVQIISYEGRNNSYTIKVILPELSGEEQASLRSRFSLSTCISPGSRVRESGSIGQLKASEMIKQLIPPSSKIQSLLRTISRSTFSFSAFSKTQIYKFIDLAIFYRGRLLQFEAYSSRMFSKLWENQYGRQYLLELSQQLNNVPILPLPFMRILISHLESEQLQSTLKALLTTIPKTRSPKYEVPSEKNYPYLLYETQFYSDYYLNQIEGEKKSEQLFGQPQIHAEFLSIKEETSRRIIVKLGGEHLISNLILKIQRSQQASKANYSVYSITPKGKQLIGAGRIQEHQWGQLSKEIYKREIEEVYRNCSQLNSFGLQIPQIRAQYLQIELSFTELGNFGHPNEISKIPQGDIIPELYGYPIGSSMCFQDVEDIFVFNPQEMFFLATSAVSTIPLLKYSVSKGKQTECLYYKVQEDDESAIRAKISEKIQKQQFESVISLQRKLIRSCKSFSSKICLDYLYTGITLILQTLHERGVKVNESISKDLYQQVVRVSHGPIKLTAFKALSNSIPYLVKSLQFLEQQLTSLGKLTFSYEELSGVLDFNNSQLCQSLTRLILRVVECQPRWTQLLIKMSSKTQAHQQITKFFASNDLWLSNKAVLDYVGNLTDHFFQTVFLDVITYSQLCRLVTKEEVKERRELMLEVIVERASEENQVGLDVVSLVFQQQPVRWDHLQKIATCCAEAVDTVVHQFLQSEDAANRARQHQTLLELSLQAKYSEEFAVFLGKVYHQNCHTFKDLIIRTTGKVTTLHYDCLEFLNDFICRNCNFGGIEGAKFLSEQELSCISVATETLKVLEKAPEAAQLANESELIEWYLHNNEYEQQNSSPANKSLGYYLMKQLIELVRSLLRNCQQLTLKVLEKYTSEVQRLRGSRRISLAQKHKIFHRLHHGATQLSLASLPTGELAQVLVGSSSPVLATVLDQLKKSTLAGSAKRGKTYIAKQIDISERFKATNCQQKDLQGGKTGVKSPALRIPLSQKQILLDSQELQWPSKVAVGFVLNDHLDNKTSILPSSVQLFGGNGKALFKISQLKQVEDQFYLSFGVRVFVADLNASASSGLISGGVKKLELRLHEPLLCSTSDVLENTQRSKKGATYNISFLHIGGYDSLPAYQPDYSELYVTLLGFLGQPKYLPDLRTLLASDIFDQKLELIIQVLNDLLPNESIQQLLLSLNKQGENILEHILRSPSANSQLVSKLILGKMTRENIARLLTYTLEHLNEQFVRIVTMSLKLASYAQPQQPLRSFSDFANIQQLVNLYLSSENPAQGLYFKLLVGLMSVPNLYHYDAHKLTTLAWQSPNRSRLYSLLAAVLPFHPSEANSFASNLTLSILQQLLELLEENKRLGSITKSPQPQLLLLNSLLGSESSRSLLLSERSPIKMVQLLQCSKTLLMQYPSQIMKLFISYFQNTCIGSECQDEFSEILITLMTSLNSFSSSNQQFFIHHFFFPLINSFQGVTVYFAWTHSAKRIWQPTQVLKASPIRSSSHILRFEDKYYAPVESVEQISLKEEFIVALEEDNHILYKCSAGKMVDVSASKPLSFTHSERTLTIKVNDETTLTLPNEKYIILEQTPWEQQLLTNATLLNLQNPWILQEKYRIPLVTKDSLTQRSYYLPQEIPISEILKNINIAGFRIHPKDLANITIKNHIDGSALEHQKTLKQVLKSQKMPFIRLEIEATEIFQNSTIESLVEEQPKLGTFVPQQTIFRAFEEKKGLEKLIGVLTGCVSNWSNAQQSKIWSQYLNQLNSYSCFPVFSSFYVTKQANVNLLFDLLFGLPDKQDSKKWLQKQKESVKQLYNIVKDIFAVQGQQANIVRNHAVKSGFYSTMLNRLHLITKEIKRYRVDQVKEQEDIVPNLEKKPSEPGDDYKSKLIKKKGVGYGTDSSSNQKWDITGQEEQRKEQSEQILSLLRILEKYLNNKEFKFPPSMLEETFESSLLPIIENSLRGGSLLQISKYAELIEGELSFIEILAKSKHLIQTLMPIPKHYEPRQPQSLHSLLKTLANTSKIFVSCLTGSASEKVSEEIAKKILSTFEIVDEAVSEYEIAHKDQVSIKKILQLPLSKKYPILLKDLRFDYIDMKDTTGKITKHHYSSSYQTGHKSPVEKTVRLAQELADVSHALPIDHTNAIFVRCDRERVDFMQALIMGSNGTPYGHGAYLFDIHFEDNYPNGPPKVNLTTTGSGQIRFNPNLYACGKVCLSLLGTWRGSAMENWDPKVSTLLQVLVSIQSIIMSEDIYFNEPGFEHEQGTLEGEKKNEAYANIVRYGNVKFAMLENIKNPPKGFQNVIRRHFQLKKQQILEQCERWLKLADKREASYNGLVSDHNYNWCNTFKKSKNEYKVMLQKAVRQLQIELNKLPEPTLDDTKAETSTVKKHKKVEKMQQKQEITEEIDVSYGGARENVEMDINDERVRDRWSRYIGAMGVEAVSKQSKASILLFGLGALGLEIAKNIVLSGCKELALWDNKLAEWDDLSGQFFLGEQDIGHPRLERTIFKLQELNHYVKVSKFQHSPEASLQALAGFQVIIVTTLPHELQVKINDYCRLNKIKFISADTFGPFGQVFNDFGEEFEVLDKNGEETVEVILEDISIAQRAIVRVAKGLRHPYEDGQTVRLVGVKGMRSTIKEGQSINGSLHKIQVINQFSFYIGSTLQYTPYEGDGTARNIKSPIKLNFKSLTESVTAQSIDPNLEYYDYSKGPFLRVLHSCFLALSAFRGSQQRITRSWSKEDAEILLAEVKKVKGELSKEEAAFVELFSYTCEGNFGAISAFLGGVVSQEAFKAITGKYTPINQYFMVDFSQIVERPPAEEELWSQFVEQRKPRQARSDGIRKLIGGNLLQKLQNSKVFMVGSGAIGCELLKNFAMIQIGAGSEKGGIIVTDPDHIETSNLNRQFLFREKHLRKPKSATAAAAVSQMNPRLKGRIKARLEKVCEATKQTFSNSFFETLTIVANALDNVQARRYVDSRCVENKVPLLESGTLSSKGHVQVIIPFKTESYGSKQDPNDTNGEVPQCTLKMFPEETLHCVEWARDLFGRDFTLAPKALAKLLQAGGSFSPTSSDLAMLKDCIRMLQSRPTNFQEAIGTATQIFYQLFKNDIMQLLYTYPLDAKTKDGKPFWKLPKRPPTPIECLDAKDPLHATFITSYAVLLCKVHNIPHPKDFREPHRRLQIAQTATSCKVLPFTPSDKLAKEMTEEVNNESQKQSEGAATEPIKQESSEVELFASFNRQLSSLIEGGEAVTAKAEQFEKDCDQNGHIDLIYSMANLRARNYSLQEMDWIVVKLKAGRITPALSTTTSCIAALQTIQLLKYIKGCPVECLRNAFVNLAVPIVQLGQPGEVQKIKVHDKLETTVWERWEVGISKDSTLRELIQAIQEKYAITVKGLDLLEGGQIYSDIVLSLESKKEEKERVLGRSFMQAVGQFQDSQASNVDFTLLMAVGDQLVQYAPTLRVLLQ